MCSNCSNKATRRLWTTVKETWPSSTSPAIWPPARANAVPSMAIGMNSVALVSPSSQLSIKPPNSLTK